MCIEWKSKDFHEVVSKYNKINSIIIIKKNFILSFVPICSLYFSPQIFSLIVHIKLFLQKKAYTSQAFNSNKIVNKLPASDIKGVHRPQKITLKLIKSSKFRRVNSIYRCYNQNKFVFLYRGDEKWQFITKIELILANLL